MNYLNQILQERLPSELIAEIESFLPHYAESYTKVELYVALHRKGLFTNAGYYNTTKRDMVSYIKERGLVLHREIEELTSDPLLTHSKTQLCAAITNADEKLNALTGLDLTYLRFSFHYDMPKLLLINRIHELEKHLEWSLCTTTLTWSSNVVM